MPSVCFDCKLYYGHTLKWCPGCAKELGYLTWEFCRENGVNWDSLKDNKGWKMECQKDLYEVYLNGEFQFKTHSISYNSRPMIMSRFNLDSIEYLYFDYDEKNRTLKPFIRKPKCEREYIPNCVISYRLTGSDLPV